MKKFLAIGAAVALAFALVGCASGSSASSASSESAMSTSDTVISASSESASSSSASASSASTVTWKEAKSAKQAAKKAGLDGFACPADGKELSIGKTGQGPWSFLYADGMAEADGGISAASVVIRKSKKTGDNTAELSDYTKEWADLEGMTYANEWTMNIGDIEVRCYGNEKGKASKMLWDQNGYGYSTLVLGQGDNWADFGIDQDDVSILVGAIIDANKSYDEEKSASAESASAEPANEENDDSTDNAEDYVNSLVWQNGLGELVSYQQYQDDNGNWILEVVTRGADGNEYTSTIGPDGNVIQGGGDDDDDDAEPDSDSQVQEAVWENGLGEFVSSEPVTDVNGNTYQEVVTRGADGELYTSYLDSEGNVVQGGIEQ